MVLALIFAGVVCHAYAAANSTFAPMPSNDEAASSPGFDDTVGAIDDAPGGAGSPNDAVAGPVGGPVPDGVFGSGANGPSTALGSSDAALVGASALVVMGGAVAGYFF